MDNSDLIAVAALIVSFMALFVSFSTKFSKFANAPWINIIGFMNGVVFIFMGFYVFYLWSSNQQGPPPLSVFLLGMVMIGAGLGAIVAVLRDERKRSNRP